MNLGYFQSKGEVCLYHQSLASFKWLIHGFSLRRDLRTGLELSLGFNDYQPKQVVEANRQKFLRSILDHPLDGITRSPHEPISSEGDNSRLVTLQQIHSDRVYSIPADLSRNLPKEGDGLITARTNLFLAVQTADCMSILIVDTERRVVAAIHAGWRGTLRRIVQKTVEKMQDQFSCHPKSCVAVIGPAIRGCCYEVGEEVFQAFQAEFDYAESLFRNQFRGRKTLDLPMACRYQLVHSGLGENRIYAEPPCTSCHTNHFFSHRAEAGKTGRMMGVIGMAADRLSSQTIMGT